MTQLLATLTPIVLIVLIGITANRALKLEPGPLSKLTLYILTPALVGYSIYTAELPALNVGRLLAAFVGTTVVLFAVVRFGARAVGLPTAQRRGLVATTLFPNLGNMGLPLAFFALGEAGLARAIVLYVAGAVLLFGFGPGLVQGTGLRAGTRTILRLPLIWALLGGLALRLVGRPLPLGLANGVELLGQAAVPVLLLVLGIQIARRPLRPSPFVLGSSALRLVGGPIAAYAVARLLGLDPLGVKVLVLLFATPTAVNAMLIATEFGGDGERTAQVVVASTLLAAATLPLVLWLLVRLPS